MSAFICSHKHIVTIVVGANLLRYTPLPLEELQRQADLLYRENIRSVNYRYNERNKITPVVFTSEDVALVPTFSVASLVKLAECLDYQSCQRSDWEKSKAYHLLNEIRVLLLTEQTKRREARNTTWSI